MISFSNGNFSLMNFLNPISPVFVLIFRLYSQSLGQSLEMPVKPVNLETCKVLYTSIRT